MRFLFFLLFPVLEFYLLIKAGGAFGAGRVILWTLASALVGVWAIRSQGQSALVKAQADIAAGRVPQSSFLDGALLFMGGILLILPGFISDFLGLLLLLPPVRKATAFILGTYMITLLAKRMSAPGEGSRMFFFRSSGFPGGGQGGFSGGGAEGFPGQGDPRFDDGRISGGDVFDTHASSVPQDPDPSGPSPAPRQAVILEASSIDIEARDSGKDGEDSDTADRPAGR